MANDKIITIQNNAETKSLTEPSRGSTIEQSFDQGTSPSVQLQSKQSQGLANATLAIGAFKKIGTGIASRVGAYTRNEELERKVNNTLQVATYATIIAMNPIAGGIYTTIDVGFKEFDRQIKRRDQNIVARYNRDAIGLLFVGDGARRGRRT